MTPITTAAELRAIAAELADTAPRLLAADQWACDRLTDLLPRLRAVADALATEDEASR